MATAASEAVPTPASMMTGTFASSMIIRTLIAFYTPLPEPMHAAHRDGGDLSPAGLERARILLIGLVFAGTDDEALLDGAAGDGEGLVYRRRWLDRRVAAADEMHDLEAVALARHDVRVLRARD